MFAHGGAACRRGDRTARAAPTHEPRCRHPGTALVRPESRDETIVALVEAADVHALPVLEALLEGNLSTSARRSWSIVTGTLQDALTGAPARSIATSWSR